MADENAASINAETLVGTWLLQEHVTTTNGKRRMTGEGHRGLLIYEKSGYMIVGINFSDQSPGVFYGGTYWVMDGKVFHEVSLSSAPQRLGKMLARTIHLEEPDLTLRDGDEVDGAEIRWRRASSEALKPWDGLELPSREDRKIPPLFEEE